MKKQTHIQPRVLRHHSLDANAHALNYSQQTSAPNCRVTRCFHAATDSKGAPGQETCYNYLKVFKLASKNPSYPAPIITGDNLHRTISMFMFMTQWPPLPPIN